MSIFSENLRFFREKKHLSKVDMGKLLSITPVAYGYYESGQREPKISALYKLAEILEVNISELLTPRGLNNSLWAKDFKEIVDDGTGFLISGITDNTISITRVNYSSKESKEKFKNFIKVSDENTLTFAIENIRELYEYCTQIVGTQIFSNTMKSLFVQYGLADVIIGADAYLHGKEHEGMFVGVSPDMYPATKGFPRKDNQE